VCNKRVRFVKDIGVRAEWHLVKAKYF